MGIFKYILKFETLRMESSQFYLLGLEVARAEGEDWGSLLRKLGGADYFERTIVIGGA